MNKERLTHLPQEIIDWILTVLLTLFKDQRNEFSWDAEDTAYNYDDATSE